MAYGVLLGQRPKTGLGTKVYLTAYQDTSSLTNVTATGQNTGKSYTASYNTTAQAFIFSIDVYDTYIFSGVLDGNTLTQTAVVNASKKIDVVLGPVLSSTLNDNSWAAIRYAADNNLGESVWAVGDAKQITINATIGTVQYSNYQPWVYILGFNHNSELEGNNLIHFGCFRNGQSYSSTNSIALDDGFYNNQTSSIAYNMNSTNTNVGGWQSSRMRTIIINADTISPSSASANSFLAALPSDLKAALKQCIKYTDNTGGSNNNPIYVTATQDWIWLLAEYEIFGDRNYANSAEQNYQKQYQYYIDGNSKAKYRQSIMESAALWWARSPNSTNSDAFCGVNSVGSWQFNSGALYSYGFAPAFCV